MKRQIKEIRGTLHMRVAEGTWRPVPPEEVPLFAALAALEAGVKTDAGFRAAGVGEALPPSEQRIRSFRTPSTMVGGVVYKR